MTAISEDNALSREELLERHKVALAGAAALAEALSQKPTPPIDNMKRIQELGLTDHLLEIHEIGYTVIPPEKVTTPEMVKRLQDAIIKVAERRTGVPHALDKPGNPGNMEIPEITQSFGDAYNLYYLLMEDEAFQDYLENETLGTLMDHMLANSAQLSSMMVFLRWCNPDIDQAPLSLGLHSDSIPPNVGMVYNSALLLTESEKEDGAMAIVPGSHRMNRHPHPGEGVEQAVPVSGPVGSLAIWHGNTWHGAFQRSNPGIRLNLQARFSHRTMKTMEMYQNEVPDEILQNRSARFLRFLAIDDPFGWKEKGAELRQVPGHDARIDYMAVKN